MSKKVTIEQSGINVWLITLPEPINNEERVKSLPDVKNFIDDNIKVNPYFQNHSGKCWYLVDKEITDNTDYLKEIYLEYFIGKELLPDAKESLNIKGFLDIGDDLTPVDKEHFERHIKEGDEIELVAKYGVEKIKVFITNIKIVAAKKDEYYRVKYTLVRI